MPPMRCVGTFGGYEGRAIRWLPDKHGLLAFAVRGTPLALTLYWSFAKSGERVLGELACVGEGRGDETRHTVRGWVTLEQEQRGVRVLLGRAWPAMRCHHPAGRVHWRTDATQLLAITRGRPQVASRGRARLEISEPWLVLFAHGGTEDTAVLLTMTCAPTKVVFTDGGVQIDFAEAGAVHVMPLEGLRRRRAGAAPLEHWTACARAWVPTLLAFPTGCDERGEIVGDQVRIHSRWSFERLEDAWGNEPRVLSPVPPSLALAAAGGYPVELPPEIVSADAQLCIPTFYGPFHFVRGDGHTLSLPMPVCLEDAPPPERSHAPWAEPIRQELADVVDAIGTPSLDYVDNNLRTLAFLADAIPELDLPRRERARSYAEVTLLSSLRPLHRANEPLTQQSWWTVGKTWRSHFASTDPAWAKDHERFDSEFYNGQALSAIEAAGRIDPALAAAFLEEARQLDLYGRIFRDWPTGSILTHATGDSANLDGVQFAWEGMIAAARLARTAGDAGWYADAVYRAARQQAALYAMWCHASWVRELDYAIGHVSQTRLPADEVLTIGPIDAFVEECGAATLELRSYWQTTNFLFYANRPLFDFYRRYGLTERIRTLEYELMPQHHPRWFDGDAVNADCENGQERYGAAWTAAHLAARASLFDDDPVALFGLYQATKTTPAAQTWYRMQLPQVAGPLLLALLEAAGPANA
jgi:hypothetical protein